MIKRPTTPRFPLQKGRWEVPGMNFIDLTDEKNEMGLSVFVYDKYGFHCSSSEFGVSLLRAPKYGTPNIFKIKQPKHNLL